MNIQGELSGGYIRNAGLGSLPKIVNSYAQLVSHFAFWSFRDNHCSSEALLLQSLTGLYVLHYLFPFQVWLFRS